MFILSKLISSFREFDKKTAEYIYDEANNVKESNMHLLLVTSIVYFFVLGAYNIVVPLFFASWNVSWVYQMFLIIQAVLMVFMWIRFHGKNRSFAEVQRACIHFHMFVMLFIILVSILPIDMEQPAMYFCPILMCFTVTFMFRWTTVVTIVTLETVVLNILSFVIKSREVFYINIYASLLTYAITLFLTYVIYDVRFRDYENQKRLKKANATDALTQINNRRAMEDLILKYMNKHPDGDTALMMMDVDHFKTINDSMGHPMGDFVLAEFAKVISEAAGTQNFVGRIGGDEFMVFLHHADDKQAIISIAEQIKRKTSEIPLISTKRKVTCSIGICMSSKEDNMSYETLFKCADVALYNVKKQGRNGYAFFDDIEIEGEE